MLSVPWVLSIHWSTISINSYLVPISFYRLLKSTMARGTGGVELILIEQYNITSMRVLMVYRISWGYDPLI